MTNSKVELKDSEKRMEDPRAVEKKVDNTAASEVPKGPEIQSGSLEIVRHAFQAEKEPAIEMPSEEGGETAAPVTPLKQDNISKEAITEKSPEVRIGASPAELAPASLHNDGMQQQSSEETHPDNIEKAKHLQHEDFASYQTQVESIVNRKFASDHDLATASYSLRPVYARFREVKAELDHVVSNLARLTHCMDLAAKERDELRRRIDELTTGEMAQIHSVPSADMSRLKLSVERVQSLIEQVSGELLSCVERSFPGFMQPMWHSSPRALTELYICSVVSQTMFSGFENENFMVNEGASAILDLETLRNKSRRKYLEFCNRSAQNLMMSDHLFYQFASEKKTAVLKDVKKIMLVGTVDLREALMTGDIGGRLEDLAKEVWAMHKLSLSMEWRARILRVRKGVRFDERWMEAVNSPPSRDDEDAVEEVEVKFVVMPGFQVLDTIVSPCRVHVV